jgi:hypothetical protein
MERNKPPERSGTIGEQGLLSPEESLTLIEAQRLKTVRSLWVDPSPILGAWGVAWIVGFGALYLTSHRGLGLILPGWLVALVFVLLFAVAAVVSFGEQIRRGRGVEGPTQRIAAMYGWSWPLAFAALFAIDLALGRHGLPSNVEPLLWTGSSLLVVGLLYLAGGMLWCDRLQYGLGVWILVAGAASVAAGVPGNFAVLSLAGGGGFLVAAAIARARRWHSEQARG